MFSFFFLFIYVFFFAWYFDGMLFWILFPLSLIKIKEDKGHRELFPYPLFYICFFLRGPWTEGYFGDFGFLFLCFIVSVCEFGSNPTYSFTLTTNI